MKNFFAPNIGTRGRILRAIMAVLLLAGAWFAFPTVKWLGGILLISGLVGVVEVFRGWCVLRACGIKTKF